MRGSVAGSLREDKGRNTNMDEYDVLYTDIGGEG